jgi:hypothetical protein
MATHSNDQPKRRWSDLTASAREASPPAEFDLPLDLTPPSATQWSDLAASARLAEAPADIDVSHAVRAEILSRPARVTHEPSSGWLEPLIALTGSRGWQIGLASLLLVTLALGSRFFDDAVELSFIFQLHAPLLGDF